MSMLERPLLPKPDIESYKHLSEKERMVAGFPYKSSNEELVIDRKRASALLKTYNSLDADDKTGRRRVLDQLLNPKCLGNQLYVNVGCVFMDCAPITIGDNCLFAPGVHVYAATHPIDPKYRQDNDESYELAFPVTIGNDCWIGGNTIICPGVIIGDNVTVGAGSVVTKNIPSNVIAAGNPAKIIRYIGNEL